MPLQKRVLLLICDECKQLIARMPYMVKMMEEIKRELADLKVNYRSDTYANVLKNTTSAPDYINKPSLPTIIIRPKSQQNIGKNKEEVQRLINPCEINVGIRNTKETKKGNIVLKCDTEQELERLKKSAERKLKGYVGNKEIEELEESIRKQNTWMQSNGHFKRYIILEDIKIKIPPQFMRNVQETYILK
ncbi:unnamed protein product [Acanthoscelides obtectus]|uniref:Uncharacterized protein n=1 Tax=Acanthoscelides obtectus TaxID=200917 RepID=A0A9P0KLW5_ACAOB|nr:unnamed protein product [Acanthoscelides obtectus]CAK1653692.1 hypothetical protein AOBTE_LOCUS18330 [Acanthoscelides obtectus]